MIQFQSTPSQRGRHNSLGSSNDYRYISIHALAKRATPCQAMRAVTYKAFQSTPSQRGRHYTYRLYEMAMSFQSTPSQRGRHLGIPNSDTTKRISIHALAKRATYWTKYSAVAICYFNPRPRKEGDTGKTLQVIGDGKFQSTPSQRGRHK